MKFNYLAFHYQLPAKRPGDQIGSEEPVTSAGWHRWQMSHAHPTKIHVVTPVESTLLIQGSYWVSHVKYRRKQRAT